VITARRRLKLAPARLLKLAPAQVVALAPDRLRKRRRRSTAGRGAPSDGRRPRPSDVGAPRSGGEPSVAARRGRTPEERERGRASRTKGRTAPPGTPATSPNVRRRLRLRRRRRRLPPRARLAIAVLVVLIGLLAGGWLWLRDSSLVSIERVTVTGATSADAGEIASALTAAARRMTTLDVDQRTLRRAVSRYPVVAALRVTTHFPHRVQIRVIERVPLGTVALNGRQTDVAADGTLLPDIPLGTALPALSAGAASSRGGRLAGAGALEEVALLAAAPYPVIARLSQVTLDPRHGLSAQVRGGPVLYFGDAGELSAKWTAASEVLADPSSAGAAYIDVSDPHRPAAGIGGGQAASAATAGGTEGATTGGTQGATAGGKQAATPGSTQAASAGST
jgi:cell division protein FtsQ